MLRPCTRWLTALCVAGLIVFAGLPALGQQQADLEKRVMRLEAEYARLKLRTDTDLIAMGREIYKAACLSCHGINGDGNGTGAPWLDPKPRDFRQGLYKWRTTPFGALPADADLERTIRDGISGTEMFPFGEILTERSRNAVAQYIKVFAPRFSDPAALPKPEDIIPIPDSRPFEASAESIEAGSKVFAAKGCVACHGSEGRGDGPAAGTLVDSWGNPVAPWDFTRGYYKSGATDQDLYRTISTGMNGTPMVSFMAATTEEERWQLVDYIRSLGSDRDGIFHYLFAEEPGGRVYGE